LPGKVFKNRFLTYQNPFIFRNRHGGYDLKSICTLENAFFDIDGVEIEINELSIETFNLWGVFGRFIIRWLA